MLDDLCDAHHFEQDRPNRWSDCKCKCGKRECLKREVVLDEDLLTEVTDTDDEEISLEWKPWRACIKGEFGQNNQLKGFKQPKKKEHGVYEIRVSKGESHAVVYCGRSKSATLHQVETVFFVRPTLFSPFRDFGLITFGYYPR